MKTWYWSRMSVSRRLNAIMNDVGGGRLNEMMNDVDVCFDISFICRHYTVKGS